MRVLFVCVGNACRSQMAEAFARAYGSDVIEPMSAGLAPAVDIPPDTARAMEEKNIDLKSQFPKSWWHVAGMEFDLVVNMSGCDLPPGVAAPQRAWKIEDPFLLEYEQMCRVRDQIELQVMSLILELRRAASATRAHKPIPKVPVRTSPVSAGGDEIATPPVQEVLCVDSRL